MSGKIEEFIITEYVVYCFADDCKAEIRDTEKSSVEHGANDYFQLINEEIGTMCIECAKKWKQENQENAK